jgi:hypothetical protein
MRRLLVIALALLGCSTPASPGDAGAGTDAPLADAGHADGGVTSDAAGLDAATDDAGPGLDAGGTDAGTALALPPVNGGLDYQLGGAYAPPSGVTIVSRDRTAAPAAGLYNICYVNGFQIQPGEEATWMRDHPTLLLRDAGGNPVIDVDWGETLIDTSTAAKRTELAGVIGGWIDQCAADGFDAVEIDNLDSYARSMGLLTADDNVAAIALFAARAHAAGLAIAQKNSTDLVPRRAEMGTDFVVAEECNTYSECDQYIAGYGEHVLMIEYVRSDFDTGCAAYPGYSIVLRDRNLVPMGSGGYVYSGC